MDHSWVPHGTPIFRKPPYIHCKLVCTDNTAADVSLIATAVDKGSSQRMRPFLGGMNWSTFRNSFLSELVIIAYNRRVYDNVQELVLFWIVYRKTQSVMGNTIK